MPARDYYLPQRGLVENRTAALIEPPRIPRSRFKSTFMKLMTFDAGKLYPFLVQEILPGDHMEYRIHAYVRMATPLFPLFTNQRIDTHLFFSPNRIVWPNWVKMMGEQDNPNDSVAYTVPTVEIGAEDIGSIFDYMDLPGFGQITDSFTVSALPFRHHNLIYNEWFRDENLSTAMIERTGDSGDLKTDFSIQRRAKTKDYFTAALLAPQKFTAPNIPVLGTAWVKGIGVKTGVLSGAASSYESPSGFDDGPTAYAASKTIGNVAGNDQTLFIKADTHGPQIYADLASATGVAINQLRLAWLIQTLYERDARGGTRYVEHLKSHWGVTSPDFRLQRPEYIGGGQSPLQLTPIAQTAPTTGVPLGALGAAGTAYGEHRATYAATEHGYIIGFISIKSELGYQQGVPKHYMRSTRLDFFVPALDGLGEQIILNREIYATGDPAEDITTFGYKPAWEEYRTEWSKVAGMFRSRATGTLDAWHLYQKFTAMPVLGDTFISDTPPMDRVLAAGSLAAGQQFLACIQIERTATRAISMWGTPVTIGRF